MGQSASVASYSVSGQDTSYSENSTLAVNSVAWVLIIIGATIIVSALIRWVSPGLGIHRVIGGLAGGLVFALILTQGFNFFTGIVNVGNISLPYSTTEVKTYSGASPTDSVYLRLGSMNGQITLSTWEKNEYYIEATHNARGAQRRRRLTTTSPPSTKSSQRMRLPPSRSLPSSTPQRRSSTTPTR